MESHLKLSAEPRQDFFEGSVRQVAALPRRVVIAAVKKNGFVFSSFRSGQMRNLIEYQKNEERNQTRFCSAFHIMLERFGINLREDLITAAAIGIHNRNPIPAKSSSDGCAFALL